MRKSFLYILTGALLLSSLCAQARKGHRLGRYGIVPGGYSGITALGDDRYAVVSDRDKQAGFHVWHIVLNPQTGALEDVCEEPFRAQEGNMERDAEGVEIFREDDRAVGMLVETAHLPCCGIVGRIDVGHRGEVLEVVGAEGAAPLGITDVARGVELLDILAKTYKALGEGVFVAQAP